MNQYAFKSQTLMPQSSSNTQQLAPLSTASHQSYQSSELQGPPQQLPPIYSQNGPQPSSFHPGTHRTFSNGPHTPHTPHTPTTPVSSSHANGIQQNGPLPSLLSSHQSSYPPILPTYSGPQSHTSLGSTSSAGHSLSSSNGPQQSSLPIISPANYGRQMPLPPAYSSQQMLGQPLGMHGSDPRYQMPITGAPLARRGILAAAPGGASLGRSVPEINNRTPPAPVKNAEGKYPCQYCSKTYLHAKHLKRHNLRHTGERPYQCSLCNETFCRSDILKRHFSKCAVRRGNPQNMTHLTHAQAHLRGSQPSDSNPTQNGYHGAPNSATADGPPPVNGAWRNGLPSNSGQSSRSSSLMRPGSSGSDDKKRFPGANSIIPSSVGIDANGNSTLTSHPSHQLDRNYSNYALPPDRLTSHSYQDAPPPAYSAAPSSYPVTTSQHESQSGLLYNQSQFNHYSNGQPAHMNGEWNNPYFQPGAHQDAMMFSQ